MSDAASANSALGRRRWLILGVIALAQLMVVLDLTVMNIALPSAQRALHFNTVDRQWVVTAYTLAFGSLLLLGGTRRSTPTSPGYATPGSRVATAPVAAKRPRLRCPEPKPGPLGGGGCPRGRQLRLNRSERRAVNRSAPLRWITVSSVAGEGVPSGAGSCPTPPRLPSGKKIRRTGAGR
jgi:hypothetical protein